MLIIGIDPGISGSLCFFEDGKIIDILEMPSMADGKKNKRQVNGAEVTNIFEKELTNESNRIEELEAKNEKLRDDIDKLFFDYQKIKIKYESLLKIKKD